MNREKLRCTTRAAAERAGLRTYVDAGDSCGACGVVDPVRYLEGDACANCARQRDMDAMYGKPGFVFGLRTALDRGEPGYYQSQKMCPRGPHLKLFSVANPTVCLTCRREHRGPRATFKERIADKIAPEGLDRYDARDLGFQYYMGKPCRRGHRAPRYATTGGCLECLGQWSSEDPVSWTPGPPAGRRTYDLERAAPPPPEIRKHMPEYDDTVVLDGVLYRRYEVMGEEHLAPIGTVFEPVRSAADQAVLDQMAKSQRVHSPERDRI